MSVGQIVVLIVGILVLVALINVVVWIPILGRIHRQPEKLREELVASGDHLILGPEGVLYRGSNATGYPRVSNNGTIALTDRRLAIRPVFGRPIDLPTAQIVGLREDRSFLNAARAGRIHVVVGIRDGGELGFYVTDNARWLAALRTVVDQNARSAATASQ